MIPIEITDPEVKRKIHLEKAMYAVWLRESGESNEAWVCHLKKCISVAIDEVLTEKQRCYLTLYLSGYTSVEISKMYEVNPSTVSRTLNRAIDKLTKRIKYATPRTLHIDRKVKKQLSRLYM